MSVQLIAENTLVSADFYSATEQEGEHIGQPIPATANTGDFRLLTKGDIADFTYSGTATGDGTTTTIIDSVLCAFGDDYFIGATITFTDSGASPVGNTSGSKTITDFAQATGTLTWAGALNSTIEGDTFTLTMPFDTRDFRVALIGSGDAGDATFKWSHDGGTIYFGRDDPDQADWLAEAKIDDTAAGTLPCLIQATNGDLIVSYSNDEPDIVCKISSDKGLTWGSDITDITNPPYCMIVLSSGRILAFPANLMFYSDDNGQSWTQGPNPPTGVYGIVELPSGNLVASRSTGNVYVVISNDGGMNWGSNIEVSAASNAQNYPRLGLAKNGDLICVYSTDEDAVNDYEIKCKISSDGGATWGSVIDIIDIDAPGGDDLLWPSILVDIDGTIFCAVERGAANKKIIYTTSTDNGETWAAQADLKSAGATDIENPCLALVDGHQILCAYIDETNNNLNIVRRGIWEAYSANACPCAIEATPQHLICEASVVWHGGAGDAGDNWQFEAKYDYAMSNLIQDSPSKPWRSEQDNISCEIILDVGTYEALQIDGVGFFGCNLRTFDFDLDSAVTFDSDGSPGSPAVENTVSFDLTTGTVDSVTQNAIKDTSLMAEYKDHELAGRYYLRMTSGTDDGVTWLIKDNTGDYIFLDTTAANNISATDTFVIFQRHVAKTFTSATPYRFARIDISAQQTAEDYYQVGTMVAGKTITLSKAWDVEYGKTHEYDIQMARTPHYGLIPIRGAGRRRRFNLTWTGVETTMEEMLAVLDHIEGKNIVLIPDSTNLKDCYLVKHIGDVNLKHWQSGKFDMSLTLEEVL